MQYQFVDQVLHLDAHMAGTVETVKTFLPGEDYFDGTFRDQDEVPSSLLLESMAFAGALLLCVRSGYTLLGVLLKVNQAIFAYPAVAGERVAVRSRLVATQGDWAGGPGSDQPPRLAQMLAECHVGEKQLAQVDLLFLGVPLEITLGSHKEEILAKLMKLVAAASGTTPLPLTPHETAMSHE